MQQVTKGLMISAPRKSSGKTTLTLGITAALTARGDKVRVFKKGPDYIDPMWHRLASGHTCYNIDPFWMDNEQCRQAFYSRCSEMDLCLMEGNHGLHDGLDLMGANSGAYLAKLLGLPVLLVVDAVGANRGIAATVLGHQLLDEEVAIAGVILNNVASQRQASKQIAAIEHYCGIPVVGAMPRAEGTGIKERHLGLVTTHENPEAQTVVADLAKVVSEHCNLERICAVGGDLSEQIASYPPVVTTLPEPSVKIGVAYDKSFCFYYPDNFDALRRAGAELKFFDTLEDSELPEVDALYIGGGFPESFLSELEENSSIREDILNKIQSGLPVYAECGGLMYLTRSIEREGVKKDMVGAIPADVLFQKKPVGKGYSELEPNEKQGWFKTETVIKGHEFHYSHLINLDPDIAYNYRVKRGTGVNNGFDGVVYKNVLASYTHLHALVADTWADAFVQFIKSKI